jgi:hypothetical protein
LHAALARTGVKQRPEIPRSNVTRSRESDLPYQSYYTSRTRDLVADWYAPEVELFGYRF